MEGLLYGMAYSELSTIAGSRERNGSEKLTLKPFGLLGGMYKSKMHSSLDKGGRGTLR